MAFTSFPMANRLAGTGAVSTVGNFPVHNVVKVQKTISVVNQFGVWPLVPSTSTRPTVGQLFPIGHR